MSNQIVISSGAKVRDLNGVLTGTSGVVNSLGINVPDGIPQLDGNGKILVAQLPNSVMEYKGTWNVSTNTPTLANGTGNQGDVYLVEGAASGGTAFNFGAGPITFYNGDQVVYSGSIWQRASGSTGTVTSVAVTESGDALTITGSPITNSGTINIGFAGTGSQYIKGDGTLATFPTTIDQAKKLITEVYNSTGATLTKGTIVYINGGQGNLPTITKAIATGDATSAQTYGVVQSDITNNNNGFVVVIGSLGDLDTQSYAAGTQLYLSGTTAGAWTSTKPSAPIHLVYIAIVVRSHPTQGVVEVRIQNGYELDELHDVAITSVANNDGIFYNSSNDLWENKTIAEVLGYTPANDSLVVHLAGTETITGAKTFGTFTQFTGDIYANASIISAAVGSASQTIYQNTNSVGLVSSGANRLGFNTNDNLSISSDGKGYAVFAFNNPGTGYTYTFPEVSGTVALTSNLSSYLPLSGGTLTGALSGTSATFSAMTTLGGNGENLRLTTTGSGNYIAFRNSSNVQIGDIGYDGRDTDGLSIWNNNASGSLVFGAGASRALTIASTGAATFSSSVTATQINASANFYASSAAPTLVLTNAAQSTTFGYLQHNGTDLSLFNSINGATIFATNNTERVRINSDGSTNFVFRNVSNEIMDLKVATETGNPSKSKISLMWYGNETASIKFKRGGDATGGELEFWTQVNGGSITQKMTILGDGNVGIGTSSPSTRLHIASGQSSIPDLYIQGAGTGQGWLGFGTANDYGIQGGADYTAINFRTNGSERMRITSSGDLAIGDSSAGGYKMRIVNASATPYGINMYYSGASPNVTGDSQFLICNDTTNTKFVVWSSGTAQNRTGVYGSLSDATLKENIVDATPKLEKLNKLKVRNFNFIGEDLKQLGFIAQEVEEVFPNMVDTDKEGLKSIKTTVLIPMLVKALQENYQIIKDLEQRIVTLESKIK